MWHAVNVAASAIAQAPGLALGHGQLLQDVHLFDRGSADVTRDGGGGRHTTPLLQGAVAQVQIDQRAVPRGDDGSPAAETDEAGALIGITDVGLLCNLDRVVSGVGLLVAIHRIPETPAHQGEVDGLAMGRPGSSRILQRLNLTPDEVRFLALHAWELQDIWADYFFFDENCSYGILFLFDVARPGLNLAGEFGAWVVPPATVEAVFDAGLVDEVVYRPSQARKIQQLAKGLSPEGISLARGLRDGEATPKEVSGAQLDDQEKARILEIDSELVHGRYLGGEIELDFYKKRLLQTLSVRSKLKGVTTDRAVEQPDPPEVSDK